MIGFCKLGSKKRKAQFFLAGGAYSANYGYSFAKSCLKKKKSPPPALASQHTQHVIQLSVREMHFLLLHAAHAPLHLHFTSAMYLATWDVIPTKKCSNVPAINFILNLIYSKSYDIWRTSCFVTFNIDCNNSYIATLHLFKHFTLYSVIILVPQILWITDLGSRATNCVNCAFLKSDAAAQASWCDPKDRH